MMFSGDEDYGDDITSGLAEEWERGVEAQERAEAETEAETEMWEASNPGSRCPPRE